MLLDLIRMIRTVQELYPSGRNFAERVKARREKRFRTLVAHAAAKSNYYKRHFSGLDLDTVNLSDLPILTKSEMMNNFDDLVTDPAIKLSEASDFVGNLDNLGKPYLGKYGICHTSGSQGRPAIIVLDKNALNLTFAVRAARAQPMTRGRFTNLHRIWSPARVAVLTQKPGFYPSSASFAYRPPLLKATTRVLQLSIFDSMQQNARKLREFRPEIITGYASALEKLARAEADGQIGLKEVGSLQRIASVAEPLTAFARGEIEKAFGVHVSDEYAMAECLALAAGCPVSSGSHINADLAILEVVDDNYRSVAPGTEGSKVLVTNLYNHVQPIIRYELDDRVTMGTEACACGSPLPHVARVTGRSREKLWLSTNEGRVRELPYYLFLAALHSNLDMAEHQVVQTGRNTFKLRASPLPGKQLSATALEQCIREATKAEGFSANFSVDVEIVPEIARGPSGKVSRVKQEFAQMPMAEAAE